MLGKLCGREVYFNFCFIQTSLIAFYLAIWLVTATKPVSYIMNTIFFAKKVKDMRTIMKRKAEKEREKEKRNIKNKFFPKKRG